MADDIRLVIGVEQGGLLKAITNTETLESKVKKLSAAYARDAASYGKYNTAVGKLAKATNRNKKELLAYGTALRADEKATKKATAEVKAFTLARKQATEEDRRRTSEKKIAVKATEDLARAEKRQADEIQKLSMKYKPLYATSQLYETKLEEINRAQRLGVLNDQQREASLEQLNMEFKNGTGAFASYGNHANQTARRTNQLGVMMQQTGYQVGDFAVQVGSGQNVMVAFGQQATQLVGTMAMFAKTTKMIALFSGLGILIPVISGLAAAWMRVNDAAKDAKESTTIFESSLSSARSEVQGMVDDLKLLQSGFKNTFELTLTGAIGVAKTSLVEAREELERLNRARAAASFGAGLGGGGMFTGFLTGGLSDEVDAAEEVVRLAIIELATAKELSRQEVQRGRDASVVNQLYEARQILAQQAADAEAQAAANTAKYWADAYTQINESKIAGQELADEVYEAFKNGEDLSKLDLGKGVNAAALAAGVLAEKLQISLAAALAMVQLQGTKVYSGRGKGPQGVIKGQFVPDMNLYNSWLESQKENNKKGGGGKDPLQTLQEQIALQQALLGKTEAQQQIINALGVDYQSKYKPSVIDALETQITLTGILSDAETKRKDALEQAAKQQEQLADFIANSMGDALMSVVDGTMSVKDAFKSMAADIIKELYRVLVVQQIVNAAKTAMGFADGGVISGGSQVQAYANGGVVGGPTMFPMAGGKTGLMGEAGPEAIMPLKRGANGKLGVQMEGGGGGDVINISQSFNFQANGDDSVKKIIAQAAPQIANMTKKSIMDDRRRGGQMKATFG